MKPCFLSLAVFLLSLSSIIAQNGKVISLVSDSLSINPYSTLYDLTALDKPPVFPGGPWAWVAYMGEIVKRAAFLPEGGHSAKVTVMFVVEKDGSLSNKRVVHSRGLLLHVILGIIDQMPCWIPAMKNGQPVRVLYFLPISVCIE